MNSAIPLRRALLSNAIFSLSSALLMILRPELVGEWLGTQAPAIFQAIGAGLAVFAADLIHQSSRRRIATWRALYASAADFSWVVGTILLVAIFPSLLTPMGTKIVLAVAVIVFLFGAWQLRAIDHAHRTGANGGYRHCLVVETPAPVDEMWKIVSNLGAIMEYMPSLRHSEILEDRAPGEGAIRACEDRVGNRWREECIEFNPGHSFTVRFQSEAPDFPFPATWMIGGWEVTAVAAGSQVTVWWELQPKKRFLAPVVLSMLAFQADREFPRIIQRMALSAVGGQDESRMVSSAMPVTRLLPQVC